MYHNIVLCEHVFDSFSHMIYMLYYSKIECANVEKTILLHGYTHSRENMGEGISRVYYNL